MLNIVVSYRYSMSPDLALNHNAVWEGPARGRSLAAIVSHLRELHRSATDVAITNIEWRDGDAGERQRKPMGPTKPEEEPSPRLRPMLARRAAFSQEKPPPPRRSAGRRGDRP